MADLNLTAEQLAVVENRGGPLLVSAAAGSGKTFVLVKRLLDAVQRGEASVEDYLIITFTKAAAAELRWRITGDLEKRIKEYPADKNLRRQLQLAHRANICTIDSFCSGLLRRWAWALDLRADFRQLEEDESAALRESVLEELLSRCYESRDEDFLYLADTVGAGRDDRGLAAAVLGLYRSTESLDDPEKWLADMKAQLDADFGGEPLDSLWGRSWAKNAGELLAGRLEEMALAVGEMEKFPEIEEKFRPLFENEISAGSYVLQALDTGWDAAAAALRSVKFDRIPTVKGAPEKERFKTVRDRYKKTCQTLAEQFSCSGAEICRDMALSARASKALLTLVEQFSQSLWQQKLRRGLMDFADIERQALRLLEHPRWGGEIAGQFKEVMVDEYQDINRLQERLFTALSGGGQRLFMVGDVKQAIYGFRLATPDIFLEKYNSFAPYQTAQTGQGRKIDLNLNFRSRGAVLECANHICAAVMSEKLGGLEYDRHQMLFQGAPFEGADPAAEMIFMDAPRGGDGEDEDARGIALEAKYVAGRIAKMVSEGVSPEDIAILLRSPAGKAEIFSAELEALGIGCDAQGGSLLFSAPEVDAFISILETLDNPTRDVHLAAAMMSPAWNFSPARLAEIRAGNREGCLYEAVRADEGADCALLCADLQRLRAAGRELAADELVWRILDEKGLLFTYGAMGGRQRENLLAICSMAEKCRSMGKVTLYAFLNHLRAAKKRSRSAQTGEKAGAVKIMSVHKSKGLEFPVVFLCGMGSRFNRRDLDEKVLFDTELGVGMKISRQGGAVLKNSLPRLAIREKLLRRGDSEEIRVLYVALTRAKEKLIITAAPESLQSVISRAGGGFLPPNFAMLSGASTPAVWLAAAALARSEGKKALAPESFSGDEQDGYIWNVKALSPAEIGREDISEAVSTPAAPKKLPSADIDALRAALDWVYPHRAASRTASKITPSALEGKWERPEDAAPLPGQELPNVWQKPAFLQSAGLTAAQRGTALHAVMQYIDFEKCTHAGAVSEEIRRLVAMEFITEAQAAAADVEKILDFIRSPIGKKALAGNPVREFKFSVLMEAERWFEGVEGEKILLQGMIDLYYKTDGGLGILDFKTDRVLPGGEQEAAEKYRGQLEAYAAALERITGEKVVEKTLYFFATGAAAAV
ncbi:MAG: helicase-exonuclease AddAB subunit AddA [Oscillospiraceae bacterium]|nr:helicase-exonuclease AddAB subunit AddA [Oscillospiraceae bacterium]